MVSTQKKPLVISQDLLEKLGRAKDDLKIDLAVFFYKDFNLSTGEAAKFAGISRVAFQYELGKRKIVINFEEEDVMDDLKGIEALDVKSAGK